MRRNVCSLIVFISTLIVSTVSFAEVIEVNIKGIHEGKKTSKQKAYMSALMNAKLQAIERAGVSIKSITTVENSRLKFDMIESKAKGVLLPGFQVIDIGYTADGSYQVVLIGKLQVGDKEAFDTGALRYTKSLLDRGKNEEAKLELEKLIAAKESDSREGAIYYYGVFGFENLNETLEKLNSWYPNSRYIEKINEKLRLQAEEERKQAEIESQKAEIERQQAEINNNKINMLRDKIEPFVTKLNSGLNSPFQIDVNYSEVFKMIKQGSPYSVSYDYDRRGRWGGVTGTHYFDLVYNASSRIINVKVSGEECMHSENGRTSCVRRSVMYDVTFKLDADI